MILLASCRFGRLRRWIAFAKDGSVQNFGSIVDREDGRLFRIATLSHIVDNKGVLREKKISAFAKEGVGNNVLAGLACV